MLAIPRPPARRQLVCQGHAGRLPPQCRPLSAHRPPRSIPERRAGCRPPPRSAVASQCDECSAKPRDVVGAGGERTLKRLFEARSSIGCALQFCFLRLAVSGLDYVVFQKCFPFRTNGLILSVWTNWRRQFERGTRNWHGVNGRGAPTRDVNNRFRLLVATGQKDMRGYDDGLALLYVLGRSARGSALCFGSQQRSPRYCGGNWSLRPSLHLVRWATAAPASPAAVNSADGSRLSSRTHCAR